MKSTSPFIPSYIKHRHSGLLTTRIKQSMEILKNCTLCPRRCEVNRLAGKIGVCRTTTKAWVSSYQAHFGEESPLVGSHGSGTIFFTHCNLLCNFCQNHEISHYGEGEELSAGQLAAIMLFLQKRGCHNINLVTPSHVVPQILAAVDIAAQRGLTIPLVYNTSAYDEVDTLKLLEGVIDIYLPDFKFWQPEVAEMTCRAPNYPEIARRAIVEMYRQVGDLVIDDSGLAQRGLLIRHLVLPNNLANTREIMRFIFQQISPHTYVNIMPQYQPYGRVFKFKELARRISPAEYEAALQVTQEEGITRWDDKAKHFMALVAQ
jgi:putative pyruvate formate lyase activating enzyme